VWAGKVSSLALQLLSGAAVTAEIFIGAVPVLLLLAVLAGAARLSSWRQVRLLALGYIAFFRGTSALVQLFWLFYALPLLGVTLPAMAVAILGLGACLGAYGAEVVRGAVLAVPTAQREAALSLGLSPWQWRLVVLLPQATLLALPPFGNLFVELLKLTSLTSLITLHDLTFQAQSINAVLFRTGPILGIILVIYAMGSSLIDAGMDRLEHRLGAWRTR
jgi:polar amino acid transport system permease protein